MNFTPLDNIIKKRGKLSTHNILIVAVVFLVLVAVGFGGLLLSQVATKQVDTTETVQTQAAQLPSCLPPDYSIPYPADPNCYVCKSGEHEGQRAIAKKKEGSRTECEPGSIKVQGGSGADFACSWCPQDAPTNVYGGNDKWASCPAPLEGFCKQKNACAECRNGSARIICRCEAPTLPPKTPPVNCPKPGVVTAITISCPNCGSK